MGAIVYNLIRRVNIIWPLYRRGTSKFQ